MVYSKHQDLRRMRAKNKGFNLRLVASFHAIATRLEKKGPEEFSSKEVKELQRLRSILTQRLLANALIQSMQDMLDGKPKTKYEC